MTGEFSGLAAPAFIAGVEITNGQLAQISCDLFEGAPDYGHAAARIMDQQRVEDGVFVRVYSDGLIVTSQQTPVRRQLERVFADDPTYAKGLDDVKAAVLGPLDESTSPFDFKVVSKAGANPRQRDYEANPTVLRQGRLARFMRARGLTEHELHGTLGKALDVLNVAAASAEPRVLEPSDSSEFMSWAQVFTGIDERNPSSRDYMATLRTKIADMLRQQVRSGKPENGELILEGPYDHSSPTSWTKERRETQFVHTGSLGNLALSYLPPAAHALLDISGRKPQ